jgi:hypothetical protein
MADDAKIKELQKPVYLGDGLYAGFDGWQIRLAAHNGVATTNEVFLEPEVLKAFLEYAERLRRALADATR